MLDAWIIEELRKKEAEQQEENRPFLELEVPLEIEEQDNNVEDMVIQL